MLLENQFWSTILLVFIIIFGIQFVCFIVSALLKTEKYFDLSGSLTYLTAILVSLLVREGSPHPRQIIVSVLGIIWCLRLGIFLYLRVLKVEDKRFDELKKDPVKFAVPWSLQVVWVFFTALGIYVVNANPGETQPNIQAVDVVGIVIWVFGFLVEAIADQQKTNFKNKYPRDFIQTGLFKYSRYPNYFGEITLWYGVFITCAVGFVESWQWFAILSPVLVTALLVFGSGVKLSEEGAIKRYGDRPDWQEYKRKTSKLILWFPKK